jgi:hypothetical protein
VAVFQTAAGALPIDTPIQFTPRSRSSEPMMVFSWLTLRA